MTRSECVLVCLVAFAASASAQPPFRYPFQHPTLRVPALAKAPKMDGKLSPGEWDSAAAITGLVSFGLDGALAPPAQQATFYLGYDANFLYLAMHSPSPKGRYPAGRSTRTDSDEVFHDDHVEWQIATDRELAAKEGHGFYKIVVNPLGTMSDDRPLSGLRDAIGWSTGGKTRCSVTRDAWDMEVSVAIKSLGLDSLDGRTLVMQLVRADSGDQNRAYVSWAPGNWMAWDKFAEVIFDANAPAVRLGGMGGPAEGNLDVQINIARRGSEPLSADCQLAGADGNVLFAQQQSAPVDAKPWDARFQKSGLKLDPNLNYLQLVVRQGHTVLYSNRIRVDRLSDEQRMKYVDEWLAARPHQSPRPMPRLAEDPNSLLAMLSAVRTRLRPLEAQLGEAIGKKDLDAAEQLCRRMIREVPFAPTGYYNLACIHAIRGDANDALDMLAQAIDHGFNNAAHIQRDTDLVSLHGRPEFGRLVARAAVARPTLPRSTPVPYRARDQVAWVADQNVGMHPVLGCPMALYGFDPNGPGDRPIAGRQDAVAKLLGQWWREGTAAGNWGDLYDNRDGDHSNLSPGLFPQMTWIEYSDHAKDAQLHWGLAGPIWQEGVVLGNASVAQTAGPYWRSMPRLACSDPRGVALLEYQYRHNHLYVYPCHVDHSPGHNGKLADGNSGRHGDVYFANTPYLVASQGSSGSDQVFLQAFAATMAAFRPQTKKLLVERGALSPTLQMIFRSSNRMVVEPNDYFTGAAQPPVFPGGMLNAEKMIRLAHEMAPNCVPPIVRLEVLDETVAVPGRDYFAAPGRTEAIFTTPQSIARVFRGAGRTRRMVVSAANSEELNRLPMHCRWVLLQGDPNRVKIVPSADSSRAEITVAWHERRPVRPGSPLETNRVDIGVFAFNGRYWSAPAFVTWFFPDNERRVYDANGLIRSVTYTGSADYVDPAICLPKSWTDTYHYLGGKPIGWTRTIDGQKQQFDAAGRMVIRDEGGATTTRAVQYVVESRRDGSAVLVPRPAEQ